MKSYACIDRVEGDFAVCEVELVDTENSKNIELGDRETKIMDAKMENIILDVGQEVHEGDIIVVEHNGIDVIFVYCVDEGEKKRRIEYLNQVLG